MPHATIGSTGIHYVRRGAGEPLLLIMGMSGNHLHWGEPFLAELERDFDIVAYDHRGVGHSAPLVGSFTIADLADDAADLMDAVGFESAHVAGISMGGMVAQELALRHPDRVRTLTLGCTYAGGPGSAMAGPEVVAALQSSVMSGDREAAIRTGWELNVSSAFAADAGEEYERFADIARELPTALNVIMSQMQAIAGHDTSARLGDVRAPTLVVHGDADQMLPVANAHAIAERIPGARLEIFEGVGHLFFWERPERSAALVRELASTAAPQ